MSLVEVLGKSGSIVAYCAGFESGVLDDVARWRPEYAAGIKKVQKRLWDLHPAVKKNVYHPGFRRSFSLKAVLPALVPEMSYKGMTVSEGKEAGVFFEKLVREEMAEPERAELRKALLDYCGQDTLAMVRIVDVLEGRA